MSNPLQLIREDHRKIEKLFKEYEELASDAFETKSNIIFTLTEELKLHMEMEERLMYEMVKATLSEEADKLVEESYAEHDVAKRILEKLSVTHPEDPQFDANVKVLNETIAHHVMEEERELLPKVEKNFPTADLEVMGKEMLAFKRERAGKEI